MILNGNDVDEEIPTVEPLKPCPFCGESSEQVDYDGYRILCKMCYAKGPTIKGDEINEAGEGWNMRVPSESEAFLAEHYRLSIDLLSRIRRQWTRYDAAEELKIREEIDNVLLVPGSDGISNPNGGIPP